MVAIFRTLFGRLSAALVALSLVLSAALALVLQSSHRSFHFESEQRLHQGLAAHLAARIDKGEISLDATFGQIRELGLLNPALAAYAVDADGSVVKASIPDARVKQKQVAVAPIRQFIRGPAAWPLLGDDPSAERGKAVFAAARMAQPAAAEFLYVVLGQVEQDGSLFGSAERSYSLREALALTLVNVFAALFAAVVLVGLVTRPVSRLRSVMEAFDASSFSGEVRYVKARSAGGTRDEIDRLGEIFDSMADRISAQIDSLRRSDDARRELYANLSHDLQTPLTSLHGYLQTLLMKNGTLQPAQRRRYLEIAARQTDQLRQLADQLTDLARLETPELRLERQEIKLQPLLHQIVEDLKPLSEKKNLKVSVKATAYRSVVPADTFLLRRALANIILNAIQAAPPGSAVSIEVQQNNGNALIGVMDEGPGLQADDMRRLLEPFYRGRGQAGTRFRGMGLGLTIARKVIELHGGTVSATNPPAGGALFSITLPASTNPLLGA